MSERAPGGGRRLRRIAWFLGLYAVSIAVTALVAYGLRNLLIG